ncbi:MAG: hypothetical protein Q9186_003982 [Xanthomendoza sp. 1 TL-2023]
MPRQGSRQSESYDEKGEVVPVRETPSIDERRLLFKIDIHVLPIITLIYVLAFIDRVNIGNAVLFGLPDDLHLRGWELNAALAVFFVSYVVFGVPANILMKKTKPHIFLSLSMFSFGFVMIMQGLVTTYGGLVTTRFLMGIFEAGVYPGCFYLIGMWYVRMEAQKRFSFFFSSVSLAGAFGGLLASAIGNMDGLRGYRAWRWIFILEGLVTCVCAVLAFFLIVDFPEDGKWLGEEERDFVIKRLADDQGDSGHGEKLTWRGVLNAFKNWNLILGGLMYFGPAISGYGLAYFIPSIVSTYGFSPTITQLYSVIPWVAGICFSMGWAYLSDRLRSRFPFLVAGLCLALAGNLVLFTVHDNKEVGMAGLVLYTMGLVATTPIQVCWFAMNLKGHAERGIGTGWQLGFGSIAGIVGTFGFPQKDAPRYTLGYSLGLGGVILGLLAGGTYFLSCRRDNRKRGVDAKALVL